MIVFIYSIFEHLLNSKFKLNSNILIINFKPQEKKRPTFSWKSHHHDDAKSCNHGGLSSTITSTNITFTKILPKLIFRKYFPQIQGEIFQSFLCYLFIHFHMFK